MTDDTTDQPLNPHQHALLVILDDAQARIRSGYSGAHGLTKPKRAVDEAQAIYDGLQALKSSLVLQVWPDQ